VISPYAVIRLQLLNARRPLRIVPLIKIYLFLIKRRRSISYNTIILRRTIIINFRITATYFLIRRIIRIDLITITLKLIIIIKLLITLRKPVLIINIFIIYNFSYRVTGYIIIFLIIDSTLIVNLSFLIQLI